MLVEIARTKVVAEVYTFVIQQLLLCLMLDLGRPFVGRRATFLRSIARKSQQGVRIDIPCRRLPCMSDIEMGLQLRLRLECDIALLAARVVGTHEVRAREMDLQRLVVIVEHIAVVLTTQMAR